MKRQTVFEHMKSLETPEEMKNFLYLNSKYTSKGMKKLLEWLKGYEWNE